MHEKVEVTKGNAQLIEAEFVNVKQSTIRAVEGGHIELQQVGALTIDGEKLDVTQGAALVLRGKELNLNESISCITISEKSFLNASFSPVSITKETTSVDKSAVGLMISKEINVQNTSSLVMIAKNVAGDVTTLLDWRSAAAFGAVFGGVWGLFKLLRHK
ncbi:MAG: hypothetical protein HY752_03820 [Nitrospirae bacterium]|nr:hypothetical protein [Nitrospirota bacterium]